MGKLAILADSGCDMSDEYFQQEGVTVIPITFCFDDSEIQMRNQDMPSKEFYQKMRDGHRSTTSAPNFMAIREAFIPLLEEGHDLLYLTLSSGLSNTFEIASVAGAELQEDYPACKIRVVDSLGASSGYGLLLYMILEEKKRNPDVDHLADYAEKLKWNVDYWFTVDDLVYLKRGGRVSAAAAFAGTVLSIKPVLHMDEEGHLINMEKTRGRKGAIKRLYEKYVELIHPDYEGLYFISHGDCIDDAKKLESLIEAHCGKKCLHIENIGPVIGSHSGPGTLALYFIGTAK